MEACLSCDSPYHAYCCSSSRSASQAGRPAFGSPAPVCPESRCDGDTHYTGQRDPVTNEDVEAGPCPTA